MKRFSMQAERNAKIIQQSARLHTHSYHDTVYRAIGFTKGLIIVRIIISTT